MWAVVIPDGLAFALVPALLVGVISLAAYLFRQVARSNEALARTAAELNGLDRRVERLEDRVFPIVDITRRDGT